MSERGRVGCFLIMGPEAAARGERQYNSLACKRSHFIALGWDLHSRVDRYQALVQCGKEKPKYKRRKFG
jgi:hypothetical protein